MDATPAFFIYGAAAGMIGCVTGLAEILPRYRDDPLKAAFCPPGIFYTLLNGFLSFAVYGLVMLLARDRLGVFSGGLAVHGELMKVTALAGFGAMAVVRAKIFKVTLSNGSEVSVGPEHVINVLFESANAYIAKERALARAKLVEKKFNGLRFDVLCDRIHTLALSARQSLSASEQTALGTLLGQIKASQISEREKSLQAGFILLDYLGEAFLNSYDFPPEFRMSGGGAPGGAFFERDTMPGPIPAADEQEIVVK